MPGEALIRSLGTSGPAAEGPLPGGVPFERRVEPRTPTNWIAVIQLLDGTEIACTVKDVSKSGARLGLPDKVALPDGFLLRVLGYAFLFRVRLVWRSGHCAGVLIEHFGKQPPPAIEPEEPKAPEKTAGSDVALRRRWSRFSKF